MATQEPIKGAAAAEASAAAAITLRHAPSITELGRHLADIERSYEAHEALPNGCGLRHALDLLEDRRTAIRDLICTMTATNIVDAAVQIETAAVIANTLASSQFEASIAASMVRQVERVLFSVLPIVADAARLDLDAMHWASMPSLRAARFAGVGVAECCTSAAGRA